MSHHEVQVFCTTKVDPALTAWLETPTRHYSNGRLLLSPGSWYVGGDGQLHTGAARGAGRELAFTLAAGHYVVILSPTEPGRDNGLDAIFGSKVVPLLRDNLAVHGIIATEFALGQLGVPILSATAP
jgi:hypothetical protein